MAIASPKWRGSVLTMMMMRRDKMRPYEMKKDERTLPPKISKRNLLKMHLFCRSLIYPRSSESVATTLPMLPEILDTELKMPYRDLPTRLEVP